MPTSAPPPTPAPGAPVGPGAGAPVGPGPGGPVGPGAGAPVGPGPGGPVGPGAGAPVGPAAGAPVGPGGQIELGTSVGPVGPVGPVGSVGSVRLSGSGGSGVALPAGRAWLGGVLAEGVVERSDDPRVLDRGGWWAVVVTFEGDVRLYRFARTARAPLPPPTGPWLPPDPGEWTTSLGEAGYRAGVAAVRGRIRDGDVYQVNLCRVLSAPIAPQADPWALAARLARGNPAPFAGVLDVPALPAAGGGTSHPGDRIVCASPELFLSREGRLVSSSPIKGTATDAAGLLPKDHAENVMIVDLVRNDLQRVCDPGTVEVSDLLAVERHPGLVHLVSTVRGRLVDGAGWAELLAATSPPGSVSGAPKSSALRAIGDLEPTPRGPYCGGVGWVDADRGSGCLAVGIRTFWWDDGALRFGTGAGITWGSDPGAEWDETVLKARRLLALASGQDVGTPGQGPALSEEEISWPGTV